MNTSMVIQSQLLATKFFVPTTLGTLISRPRLSALLDESLKYPLTLVSAPAGFGKTTLLSAWAQSLEADNPLVAWVSLDEEDNDPRLFWTYVLSALDQQQPERFTPLSKYLQSSEAPPLMYVLTALINLVLDSAQHFLLILDDYHLITEQQVHTTLSYLVEHLPPQLHVILATRADPPLPLSLLRTRHQMLEVRTEQLRCTVEETKAFFKEVMSLQFPDDTIQQVTARTEGWLVGLQMLGLCLPEQANPATLLSEVSGNQCYILDYLTEVVLQRQPEEVQTFLLFTCILERLTASLCNAVMQQDGSQEMLQRLEQANVFLVSLDSRREWYRYHALFAEALYHQLKQTHAELVSLLHSRASLWYAQHDQTTEAILHALKACEWQWAADLIERKSLALNALSWGVSQYHLFLLRDWLNQIPADVINSRPRLCLARIWMLMFITPQTVLESWLNVVEATLTDALTQDSDKESAPSMLIPQTRQELENMLGEAITYRALLQSHSESGEAALALCRRAQALLSADNFGAHAHIAVTRFLASYTSSVNDAAASIQIGLQAGSLNQTTGSTDQAISIMGLTAMHMLGTGRLHETQRLAQQAILLGRKPNTFVLPGVGWPTIWQAEILREWNELDAALSCIEEGIKLLAQLEWTISSLYVLHGYAILLRISLSRGDYEAASSALQEVERIGMSMHQPSYIYSCSHFAIIDQIRFWLVCGELDRATHWAEELDLNEWHGTPFVREREEVARARVLLARKLPHLALQRLEPVLQRATAGKRWGHVIEIRLLQALAYQMRRQEMQALGVLSEAVRLAEPEGYIRSFIDEGPPMAALLSRLREQQRKDGPTPYLDTMLAAFPQQSTETSAQGEERGEAAINTFTPLQNQLLATKFYMPVTSGPLIARPRLSALLSESPKHPLTLVSAPAGFGKTTLLATWGRSLGASHPRLCWLSLDEEDNDPRLFWTYVLSALDMQQLARFAPLLVHLQSPQGLPLKNILTALINLLAESTEHFVLILDDYHLITEQQVHTTLFYLVEHLPAQLRIILLTRTDPPLPLPQLRARLQMLEVRTDQLRCTVEETRTFFKEVRGIYLPEQMLQEVAARMEGWLVGLHLLGLSLLESADPATLLSEVSGNQCYILDYLTEVVLQRQPEEVQTFLLFTCILERLTASLCNAVMQQDGSQEMLQRLEQANVFLVSLDNKRQWYRYHGLFAEALSYRLKQTHADLLPLLYHRASLWYAQHNQTTDAILHALKACEWQWAADLIERKSLALNALSWGISQYHLFLLRDWLMQIPADVFSSRPGLCLARIWMLMFITPQTVLESWLNAVEATLTDALSQSSHKESVPSMLAPQERQEQENMLGEVITYRALLRSLCEGGEGAFLLCQRAQALLSADNVGAHAHIAVTQFIASYTSSVNDAAASIQIGLQAGSLNQTTGSTDQAISIMGLTAMHMLGTGRLHETQRLAQQTILLGRKPNTFVLPAVGWPTIWQAEILRQWNQLDAALSCIEEGIKLLAQLEWTISSLYVLHGYAILLRISLSRGDYEAASSALREVERIRMNMHLPTYIYSCSHFATIDQIRLWLACGELDRATHWAEELDLGERHGTPFAHEREEVACARIFLATGQPDLALQRLEPVLQRATAGQRWGHVIEIRLLQAVAHQIVQEETQALDALSEALRLAEPEEYIRSFVDEGLHMEALLSRLREQQRKAGSTTPYLDKLLAAFPQQSKVEEPQPKLAGERPKTQQLVDALSERELEVLQLLARGASNQEIAQELVIAVDTVKRHVSHIFAKLDVNNRVQAVRQARELGLLNEKPLSAKRRSQ